MSVPTHRWRNLITNVTSAELSGVWIEYNRYEVMRETVRLYGEHFGVYLSEQAFDVHGNQIPNAIGLYTHEAYKDRPIDLQVFWACHQYLAMEAAKA